MEELHIGSPQPCVDTADSDAEAVLHRHPVQVEHTMDVDIELPISAEEPDKDAEQLWVMVEDVNNEDEEDEWAHTFPEASCAGTPCGHSRTLFEIICDDQVLCGAEVLGPFESDEEWKLAKWLIKNVGHNH